jgi:hypothetical protein
MENIAEFSEVNVKIGGTQLDVGGPAVYIPKLRGCI